jgi:hypothetical protein
MNGDPVLQCRQNTTWHFERGAVHFVHQDPG